MKQDTKGKSRRTPARDHRRLELATFAPPERIGRIIPRVLLAAADPDRWMDSIGEAVFLDLFGPSWQDLTGRRIEELQIEWTEEGTGHAA